MVVTRAGRLREWSRRELRLYLKDITNYTPGDRNFKIFMTWIDQSFSDTTSLQKLHHAKASFQMKKRALTSLDCTADVISQTSCKLFCSTARLRKMLPPS